MQLTKRVLAVAITISTSGVPAFAQQGRPAAKPGPWFGVPLPPPLGKEPAVIVGDRAARPVVLPSGEAPSPELTGTTIRADVEAIVNIAKESRNSREIGSGQMWGRVTGLPSGTKAVTWAADQFRKAGIADVKVSHHDGAERAVLVPVVGSPAAGDPAFGPGTADGADSASLSPSDIPDGT
jgi:hypothetical protein